MRIEDCGLRIADWGERGEGSCGLRSGDWGLRIADWGEGGLRIAGGGLGREGELRIADCGLRIEDCGLAHRPLTSDF